MVTEPQVFRPSEIAFGTNLLIYTVWPCKMAESCLLKTKFKLIWDIMFKLLPKVKFAMTAVNGKTWKKSLDNSYWSLIDVTAPDFTLVHAWMEVSPWLFYWTTMMFIDLFRVPVVVASVNCASATTKCLWLFNLYPVLYFYVKKRPSAFTLITTEVGLSLWTFLLGVGGILWACGYCEVSEWYNWNRSVSH